MTIKLSLKKNGNLTTEIKTNLLGNGKKSYYVEDFMKEKATESENNFSIKATENTVFYKNIVSKTIVYKDQIRMKFFNIKDTISSFDWKITTDKKTILGYDCQKATLFSEVAIMMRILLIKFLFKMVHGNLVVYQE